RCLCRTGGWRSVRHTPRRARSAAGRAARAFPCLGRRRPCDRGDPRHAHRPAHPAGRRALAPVAPAGVARHAAASPAARPLLPRSRAARAARDVGPAHARADKLGHTAPAAGTYGLRRTQSMVTLGFGYLTAPENVLTALRAVDPDADLVHLGGNEWMLGVRKENHAARERVERQLKIMTTTRLEVGDIADRAAAESQLGKEFQLLQFFASAPFRPIQHYRIGD